MTEPAAETSRTIPSQTVTFFGAPVTIELNRGALEIHVGNIDPFTEGERVAIRNDGSVLVRFSTARGDGSTGQDSTHHAHVSDELTPGRQERGGYLPLGRMYGPLGDREIFVVDQKSREGQALLGEAGEQE